MARANGYIIAKEFQKEGDNFQVSMDIHCENRLLVFGYGPLLKLVAINTDVNFWFEERKTFGRQTINFIDQNQRMNIPNNQRVVRDVTWNDQAKNCIGVAMGQSAVVYDTQDISNPKGFLKAFSTDDIMRQGDYPSKFIWLPNSREQFLCTSSKSDQIVHRDLRCENIVAKISGSNSDDKTQNLKFNPVDANIFATISKHSTIQIFDRRKSNTSLFKKYSERSENFQSNLLDWQWNGHRLATVYGGFLKIWKFNGQTLTDKDQLMHEHKNPISDFKWLRKHPQYLLVSQMQQNIIYGYRTNKDKHDLQILVDPRHSGLKKFMTDRNQQMILGLTNFQDSKKHQHEMIAVFIDYESSKSIWSKTKFAKPNNLGIDNQLLFAATKKDYMGHAETCYALQFQQIQSSAKKIQKQLTDSEKQLITDKHRQFKQNKLVAKRARQNLRHQRKNLQKQVKQKTILQSTSKSTKRFESPHDEKSQKPLSQTKVKKLVKSNSIEDKEKQKDKGHKSLNKSVVKGGLDKISKSNQSFSQSSEQPIYLNPQKSEWILSYYEQIQYLDKHYEIEINDQIPQKKGQNICKHNSKVAKSIGKYRCAQFWQYIYYLAFPELEQKYTLSSLYQDKVKIDVHFRDHKVIANCQSKEQIMKKIPKYSIQKIIQNLVDQNELQTAVMACVMIRNKDEKLLSLQFIQPFLICYKEILKAMGLTFISTNLSFIAKLNQAVPSTLYSFDIPIGCGQCYKKINGKKCNCLQVCIFCGQSLRDRLVIGCKICGHMAHAWQYEKWFAEDKQQKCKYRQCQHKCFKV